jgi:hypothetical protein
MRKTTITAIAALLVGCAGSTSGGADSANQASGPRATEIVHEDCDVAAAGAERMDANGDGVADVTAVKADNQVSCQAFDLNFDGKVDSWVYFEPSGQVRRRESDFDRDGRVDEIAIFKGGVLSEKHRATTMANRLDTWDYYNGGTLARTERDSDGDALVDQWWEYTKPDCPLIHSDVDGDGRPDPGATVDFCKETGYVPPERPASESPAAPGFKKPEDLPTEVDSKPMGGGAAPPSSTPPSSTPPSSTPSQKGGEAK